MLHLLKLKKKKHLLLETSRMVWVLPARSNYRVEWRIMTLARNLQRQFSFASVLFLNNVPDMHELGLQTKT
jgi:hypothetical protein